MQSGRARGAEACELARWSHGVEVSGEGNLTGGAVEGLLKFCRRRLCRRDCRLRGFRNLVGTASPGSRLPIRDQLFAFVQADSFPRPIDFVAHAIGQINQLGLVEFHDSGMAKIEACIVAADDAIMLTHLAEIVRSLHSSGDERNRDKPLAAEE